MSSEKFNKILDRTNKILSILCIVLFFVAAARITNVYIDRIDTYNDSSEHTIVKVIENNSEKKLE